MECEECGAPRQVENGEGKIQWPRGGSTSVWRPPFELHSVSGVLQNLFWAGNTLKHHLQAQNNPETTNYLAVFWLGWSKEPEKNTKSQGNLMFWGWFVLVSGVLECFQLKKVWQHFRHAVEIFSFFPFFGWDGPRYRRRTPNHKIVRCFGVVLCL